MTVKIFYISRKKDVCNHVLITNKKRTFRFIELPAVGINGCSTQIHKESTLVYILLELYNNMHPIY